MANQYEEFKKHMQDKLISAAIDLAETLDIVGLNVGSGLIPLVDEEQNGDLLALIRNIRQRLALEIGIIVPPIHIQDDPQLKAGAYSILIKGNEVACGELMIDYLLAIDRGGTKKTIDGIETREPAYNKPALWIPISQREEAQSAGYVVADLSAVIAVHLTEVIRSHAEELLGYQGVQSLLDNLPKNAPKAAELFKKIIFNSRYLKIVCFKKLLNIEVQLENIKKS